MSVAHHLKPGLTDRTRVKIMTVDPSTRRVEVAMKDSTMLQVAIWDVPHVFRWPKENEIWIIRRDNGVWMLDRRVQQGQLSGSGLDLQAVPEPAPIEDMAPGETKLDADIMIDAQGRTFIAVDLTGIQDGWTIKWDSTLKRFIAAA